MIDYYAAIAPALLPHLRDRPLTLKRYPDGVDGEYFYEKQLARRTGPTGCRPCRSRAGAASARSTTRSARTCRRWSGWPTSPTSSCTRRSSLAADVERPTMVVFDLDPGAPAGDRRVLRGRARAARAVRAARPASLREDVGLEGPPGLRPAQRPRRRPTSRPSRSRRRSPSCSRSATRSSSSRAWPRPARAARC